MKNLPWIIAIAAIIVALFFYDSKVKSDKQLKDLAVDRGLTINQLKEDIKSWEELTDKLHADKMKTEKDYQKTLAEYQRVVAQQGVEKVFIERFDTITQYVWWQPGSDTVLLDSKPEVYVGDILKHSDKWGDFRVYSDGFLVNMDYSVRDSIEFNILEDKDGWFIKGKSLNPKTTVYGLERLVKKEYPSSSFNIYGKSGVRFDTEFRPFGSIGFEPEWKFKNFDLSAYGEAGVFSSSETYMEVGLKIGYRLK